MFNEYHLLKQQQGQVNRVGGEINMVNQDKNEKLMAILNELKNQQNLENEKE